MGLRLIIEDYEGSTTVFPLGEGPVTIGREESNTICLTEKNVSRQHARLTPDSSGWRVEDLESYNGVRVNGTVVDDAHVIHEGDLIQIGDYQLLLGDDTSTRATVDLGPALLAAANEGGAAAAALPVAAAQREAMQAGARVVEEAPAVAPAFASDADYDDLDDVGGGGGGKGLVIVALLAAIGAGGWYFTAGPGAAKPAANEAAPKAAAPQPEEADAGAESDAAAPAAGADESAAADGGEAQAADGEAEPPEDAAPEDEAPEEDAPADTAVEEAAPEEAAPTPTKKKKKKKKKAASTTSGDTAPAPAPAPAGKSASELLADARKAQLSGSYSKAYSLAKQSYAAAKSPDAAQVMGVAACKMGDASKAKSAYSKLSGSKKSALQSICAKSGIEL